MIPFDEQYLVDAQGNRRAVVAQFQRGNRSLKPALNWMTTAPMTRPRASFRTPYRLRGPSPRSRKGCAIEPRPAD